jgi:uncharacterized RDD family membrane protein YckC
MTTDPLPPPLSSRPAGPSGPRAGFGLRLVGLLVDGVVTGLANQVIGSFADRWTAFALSTIVGIAYAVYFIASPSGQTPGMRLVGIRAVDALTGGPVTPGRALVRWAVSIISGVAFALGYLWMLWDPERQTWQDHAARTYVVPVRAFPVARWPG